MVTVKENHWFKLSAKFAEKLLRKSNTSKKLTCSKKCASVSISQKNKSQYQGENNPNYKGPIKVICKFCGKEFEKKRNDPKTTCSDECRHNIRSQIRVNNNPNNDPECRKKMTENLRATYKNNPDILVEMSKRQTEWIKNHPEEVAKTVFKIRSTGGSKPNK